MEVKENKSYDLLQQDPLSRPKKWSIATLVVGMVIAMLCVFAAFHWLYMEYFSFATSRVEKMQELLDVKERSDEFERRLKERQLVAEKDFARHQAANEELFKKRNAELDEAFSKRKQDFNTIINEYKERYTAMTNELSIAFREQKDELEQLMLAKESFINASRQYEAVSNALVRAQKNLDKTMALGREAQNTFNEWNGKIGVAKSEFEHIEAKKKIEQKNLQDIETSKKTASLSLSELQNSERLAQERLNSLADEIQSASNILAVAKEKFKDLNASIKNAKSELNTIAVEREESIKSKNEEEVNLNNIKNEYDVVVNKHQQMTRDLNSLVVATNQAAITLAQIKGKIAIQNETIQSAQIELQSISNKIDLASIKLSEMRKNIKDAEIDRKRITDEIVQLDIDKNAALDRKREAESSRDKAIAEKELAEKRLKERKPEIEAQITEMEKRLNLLKEDVSKIGQNESVNKSVKGEVK